jgi:hypothetical protein
MGPAPGRSSSGGSQSKMSRHRVVDTHNPTPLLDDFSTLEAILGPKANPLSIRLAGAFECTRLKLLV